MNALLAAAAFAVAAPGIDLGPVIAGESVVWTTSGRQVQRADQGSTATLYRARRGSITSLFGSPSRVVAYRDTGAIRECVVDGLCTPPRGDLVAGRTGAPLRRELRATVRLPRRAGCRRRLAMVEDAGDGLGASLLSGDLLLYERRLRCGRRERVALVVRDLRTGRVRIVRRGDTARAQIAGRYVAFERRRRRGARIVVVDLRSGRTAYTAALGVGSESVWYSLAADGTLAVAYFRQMTGRLEWQMTGRLGWFSPREPLLHRLPGRPAVFSSEALALSEDRIAFVRDLGEASALVVTDLEGNERTVATFEGAEVLDDFALEGARIAWRSSRYRPYAGAVDDGLPYICRGTTPQVLAAAPVIEVHPVDAAVRLPAPTVPAPRDRPRRAPVCDDED